MRFDITKYVNTESSILQPKNASDSRFRVIGKTNDGRDIGLKGGVVYIRDKNGLSWIEAKYDEEMVSK